MLKIENLHTNVKNEPILKGVNLEVGEGEVHAIMGKNGCGKSTLLSTIMGSEIYTVKGGNITLDGVNITKSEANERANLGLFLTFQTPYEFFEIRTVDILTRIWNTKHVENLSQDEFVATNKELLDLLEIDNEMLKRDFNVGFSGGERKRLEIMQLLLIEPKVILLDEIDTGLDVDSVITIGKALAKYQKEKNATVIIVTHLSTFLNYVTPNKVHVMSDGIVVKTGDGDLAKQITEHGYSIID